MMIRIMFAGYKRYPLILQWILYFYYCGGSFTIFWWIGKFSLCSILLPLSNTSCQCYLDRWHSCQPCFRQVETRMYQKLIYWTYGPVWSYILLSCCHYPTLLVSVTWIVGILVSLVSGNYFFIAWWTPCACDVFGCSTAKVPWNPWSNEWTRH